MKVSQIKLRGLGQTPETDWITLDPHLTTIHFQKPFEYTGFFRAIETINPPYNCQAVQPFADYPKIIKKNGLTKLVSPAKRTIILSIFEASSDLVHHLADISSLFYETDKIEVGRRFDHSRWTNFIELPSSTRWSEVSADIFSLLDSNLIPEKRAGFRHVLEALVPSDRIKGDLMNSLSRWLYEMMSAAPQKEQLLHPLLLKVNRAQYFKQARTLLDKHLPLFVRIDIGDGDTNSSCSSLSRLLDIYEKRITTIHPGMDRQDLSFMERLDREFSELAFLEPDIHICSDKNDIKPIISYKGQRYKKITMLDNILQVQIISALAIVLSRILYSSDPLLIFENSGQKTVPESQWSLIKQIKKIADHCQCIFGTGNNEIFNKEHDGIHYRQEEIIKEKVRAR